MHKIDISRIDLNLLVVLETLLEERHVGRSAERLRLSQSATSHALGRLRSLFDDPLFVRHAAGVEPTLRARELADDLAGALAQVRRVVSPARFDPATLERTFTVATHEYAIAVLMPRLLALLSHHAPGVDIRCVGLSYRDLIAAFDRGEADLACGAFPGLDTKRVQRTPLFVDRFYYLNYALYGDMSARVNAIYRDFSPRIEVYSIDESFLDISDVRLVERVTLARDMRETVRAWTGIPTCVGIGATKTLAKLANHVAKKNPALGGVCDLTDPVAYDHWMARIPPEDIWGVGPANVRKLEVLGCESAADVRDLDTRAMRKAMTVVGERLVRELRGEACLDLKEVAATRKGCAVTRSFSDRVEDRATMEQAVAAHATRLGEKLRREGLGTDHVTVFFHNSEHDWARPQRSVSTVVPLPEASNDTLVLVKAALHGVGKTWRDGFRYSKAGVVTTDLLPLHASQRAMPGLGQIDREQGAALMAALDACNRRFGRGAVVPAAAGLAEKRAWSIKFEMRSPRYTTRLDKIPVVAAEASQRRIDARHSDHGEGPRIIDGEILRLGRGASSASKWRTSPPTLFVQLVNWRRVRAHDRNLSNMPLVFSTAFAASPTFPAPSVASIYQANAGRLAGPDPPWRHVRTM